MLVLLAIVALLPTALVAAQDGTLDPAANPNYGIIGLDPRFFELMDGAPAVAAIVSGGDINVSSVLPDCRGFATSSPDYILSVFGEMDTLRVFFNSLGDTTLIIAQPDGSFVCSDDGDGLNPVIDLISPVEGEYAVWVGSFSDSAFNAGYLFMTTDTTQGPSTIDVPLLNASGGTGPINPTTSSSATTGGLTGANTTTGPNPNIPVALSPAGAISLSAGDAPYAAAVTAGGEVDVRSLNLTGVDGTSCNGHAPDAPQAAITLDGTARLLRLFFVANDFSDSTIVVQAPNGSFYCNDDFPGGNLNPLADIPNAGPGVYNVFVGTFSAGDSHEGVLYITQDAELDPTNVGQ